MKLYQKRVIAEKKLLDLKRIKLSEFLDSDQFGELDAGEQFRLRLQLEVMQMYSTILTERIAYF